MPRYFIELAYKGTAYSGFQAQQNAHTIQAEVEKAIHILSGRMDTPIELTGSSRTDAGVHARQNYFHFDTAVPLHQWRGIQDEQHIMYKLNAILPADIVIKSVQPVGVEAHCRFDARSREYRYYVIQRKDPFLRDRAYYFPYRVDSDKMKEAAKVLMEYQDFTSFSKRNTQVKTFLCAISQSEWEVEGECLVYHVKANRFLRGMVRALTATMLQVGRGKLDLDGFRGVIEAKDCTKASFAVPPHGLFLDRVEYPEGYFGTFNHK
ncbi:MAG: tRNA pseudouridine(38-40) synthase TruA [Bacteroidetes bacterium]|nr:tRNA pseudouridine(38-40) synthase TruA [Bacteroidota bacterium]